MDGSSPARLVELLRRAGRALQQLPRPASAVVALLWMAGISQLSSLSGPSLAAPRSLGYLFNLGHAPLYGLLAAWFVLCLPRENGWPRLTRGDVGAVLLAVVAFGLFDELHQSHVPGRAASLLDLLTDLTGAASVVWIVHFVSRQTAHDAALRARLSLGLAGCGLAAALATWLPVALGGAAWI